jgi:hypothetical protein
MLGNVDHLTGFMHIDCLMNNRAKPIGKLSVKALVPAVMPEIFQSDNGGEFMGSVQH